MSGGAASKAAALRRAKELGCSGAHQHPDGSWMACETHEEYERLEKEKGEKSVLSRMHDFQSVRDLKGRKKKRKNKKNWEKLGERGVTSIDTISAGLVSGEVGMKASSFAFDGDEDVFTDPSSARRRARQLGCIGVARRTSMGGNTVWTPCSNITDYARRSGSTALGRRYQERLERQRVRKLMQEERRRSRRLRRKVSLHDALNGKALGRTMRRAAAYDPNAVDGDNDGMIQDGTAFQRPAATRAVAKASKKISKPKKVTQKQWDKFLSSEPGYLDEAPAVVRRQAPQETLDAFKEIRQGFRSGRVGSGGREAVKKILSDVDVDSKGKPPGSRKLHFVGGTTGAGKTTLIDDGVMDVPGKNEAAFIDPDWIKTQLVGWDGGRGAGQVHAPSRSITDRAMDAAAEAGTDVVVTGTGKRTEHLRWARQNGYSTSGHFVYVPDAVADERLKARNAANQQSGGPVLPDWFGSQIAGEMRQIVSRQITSGLFDEFFLWNNSVQPPSLIARKTPDQDLEIMDDAAFDDFFGPTGAQYVRRHWQ